MLSKDHFTLGLLALEWFKRTLGNLRSTTKAYHPVKRVIGFRASYNVKRNSGFFLTFLHILRSFIRPLDCETRNASKMSQISAAVLPFFAPGS